MREYTQNNIVRVAKRMGNKKRSFLLVNPLQGKHVPVDPDECLGMMQTLGMKVRETVPECGLVIGFAETATAIGAVVAMAYGGNCRYIHTTRESLFGENISFREEHSHAVNQSLSIINLKQYLSETDTVIFVDDEYTTGKTLFNVVAQLYDILPGMKEKRIVAVSVLNQVTEENGIEFVSLVRPQLEIKQEDLSLEKPKKVYYPANPEISLNYKRIPMFDIRYGAAIKEYEERCNRLVSEGLSVVPDRENILVLGTEEFMYPGLAFAKALKDRNGRRVSFHATTRSPIAVSGEDGYPIFNGYEVPSFHDKNRKNYVYDLKKYDHAVILTDAKKIDPKDVVYFSELFSIYGIHDFTILHCPRESGF